MEINSQTQTEYNMAFSYLNRLNSLFYYSNYYAMDLDAHGWFHTLLAIYREISTYIKEIEQTEYSTKINEINRLISISNKRETRTGHREISPELYENLHTFELFIRTVLKRTGLQMRMEQDPTRALQ